MKKSIPVTQPDLPPLADFIPYLERIWESKWLTNAGQFHQELERALSQYLGVKYVSLFSNGTIALLTALQCLRVTGEVITTPYSFVATTHSLYWNRIRPVFVDIDPKNFNLDPKRIREAITPATSAIMPVHCYGNPCEVEQIRAIAETHGLRVIYDAAHAFGVKQNDDSILNHGDLSVLSFHATKVFSTFEGGAIVSPDAKTKQRIDYLKNFGFADEITVVAPGINGKMNEVQAAFGLLQLRHVDNSIEMRRVVDSRYRGALADVTGITVPGLPPNVHPNYSYFPILVGPDFRMTRDQLYEELKENGIMSRRYFYPLISDMPMYRGIPSAAPERLPYAHSVAEQIICLPIYPHLSQDDQQQIIDLIRGAA